MSAARKANGKTLRAGLEYRLVGLQLREAAQPVDGLSGRQCAGPICRCFCASPFQTTRTQDEQIRYPVVTPDFPRIQRVSIHAAAALAILFLSACGSNPPVVSGDLSCERFRHISATQAQIDVIAASYAVMESWVDQIASHNDTYDAACITPASDPRGKSK